MTKHGSVENKNEPGTHTDCLCGRKFNSDRGRDVHIGKMNKLSSMVLDKREEILMEKYNSRDPKQGSY